MKYCITFATDKTNNMYQLTKEVITILDKDKHMKWQISVLMDNGYMAVHMDLQKPKFGRNIAQNHDALIYLSQVLKMPIKNIRKKQVK